jgi:hypothetical protein
VLIRLGASQNEHYVAFRCKLSVNGGNSVPPAGTRSQSTNCYLKTQDVARYYLTLEPKAIQARQKWNLIIGLRCSQHCYRPDLGQSFGNKNAGHNRVVREMPLEERLVSGYSLDSHCSLSIFQVEDAVYQEKWVTMRKNCANLGS